MLDGSLHYQTARFCRSTDLDDREILKQKRVEDQEKIIELQEKLIEKRDNELKSLQSTVETEIKSVQSTVETEIKSV